MLVVILGAGGHGQVVADILFNMWRNGRDLEIYGFLDDDPTLTGTSVMGIKVLGSRDILGELSHDALVAAIGDNTVRKSFFESLSETEVFIPAIHPSAVIAPDVQVKSGAMVCAGAIINPGTSIGSNAIVNTGALLDHHNKIGAHSHVAPGVNLGGNVTVGEGAFIGIGASVIPGITIGAGAIVGAGAVVVRDIPAAETWVGVPAHKLG
ncbi:MAG: acetyltransferase [Proteobacteria bacterium]|nr:acetyltransferase [Pseudomonadota bacterium]MBU1611223.1 acetyltransferase [Pseudomonadota bacterium]